MTTRPATARHAAVIGQPVTHSLSPVLHGAAYAALGLADWDYDRIECAPDDLPALLDRLIAEPGWAGLSVTMPLKRLALELAATTSPLADAVGAANTLLLGPDGWSADNTDVAGVLGALAEAGVSGRTDGPAAVLGAGGTATAALAALAELGVAEPWIVVRDPARAGAALAAAERLGLRPTLVQWAAAAAALPDCAVVVSTVPRGAADGLADLPWRRGQALLDVVYDPWPTPLAAAAEAAGAQVASGLVMLLHQACRQVTLMTSRPAPEAAMRAALEHAAAGRPSSRTTS